VVPEYAPVRVEAGLDVTNVTWMEALVEWLARIVPVQRVVRLILANRMVRLFLDVTPGSREVVVLARVLALREAYDLVVVDLPASGHAVSFLRVAFQSAGLFPGGPLRRTLDEVLEILARPDTHVVLAALPEEMAVNEAIETWQKLASLRPALSLPLVVLNQGLAATTGPAERALLARLAGALDGAPPPAAEVVRAGRWEVEREDLTADAGARIRAACASDLVVVPILDGRSPIERARIVEACLTGHPEPGEGR
jgi:hypothetical protein